MSTPSVPPTAAWIDPTLYPYTAKAFSVEAGIMRYLDEGAGQPIVMVHGNPVWSFVYRKLVAGLADHYRCVVPDHIGFGQSDKPADWSYLPQDHAANLTALLNALALDDITLVVQDWGGPIGLSFAVNHPERVKRLVILNTWLWDVSDDWYYQGFSGFMGGPVGRFLCRRFNFFTRSVVARAYGDRAKLTREIHQHYLKAHPTPASRKGTHVFPRQIIKASPWLADLWERREAIASKPTMLAWGMKDIAFREKELQRWQTLFPAAQVTRFPTAGHYVQDEEGEAIAPLIRAFMTQYP